MNKNTSRRIGLTILASLVISGMVIQIAPVAQAQTFTPELNIQVKQFPQTALVPNGPAQSIVIHYKYTFREATTTAPTVVTTSTSVNFNPPPSCAQPGLIITGPSSQTITFQGAGGGQQAAQSSYEGDVTFSINAGLDAPGETPIECTFNAQAAAVSGQILAANAAPVKTIVTVAYYGLLSSNVQTTIDEAGPQKQITYAIDLSNVGNSRTNVNFAIDDTHSGDGWNPIAPNQVLLESRAQGGTAVSKTVNFLVSTPYKNGWNNKETTFVLKIQPVSTLNQETTGSEIQVNVLARVRGIYVPGPEPILLVGAIIGAALLLHLRKE